MVTDCFISASSVIIKVTLRNYATVLENRKFYLCKRYERVIKAGEIVFMATATTVIGI
jgi:hypothetical protein